MKIIPVFDRLLVERIANDTVSPGGIIIPDKAKEKPLEGRIVAQGEGTLSEDGESMYPLDTKVGDHILFPKHCGTDINIGGQDLLVMCEADVMCVVEPEDV